MLDLLFSEGLGGASGLHIPVTSGTTAYNATHEDIDDEVFDTGMLVTVTFTSASTGAVTLNINGLGARVVLGENLTQIGAGGIIAGVTHLLHFNGTSFLALTHRERRAMGFMPTSTTANRVFAVEASNTNPEFQQVNDAMIANNAVRTAHIQDANVTTAKIANRAVNGTRLMTSGVANRVLAVDVANSDSSFTQITGGNGGMISDSIALPGNPSRTATQQLSDDSLNFATTAWVRDWTAAVGTARIIAFGQASSVGTTATITIPPIIPSQAYVVASGFVEFVWQQQFGGQVTRLAVPPVSNITSETSLQIQAWMPIFNSSSIADPVSWNVRWVLFAFNRI